MNKQEYRGILVFIEQLDGVVQNVGLELIGKAKELSETLNATVTAVALGHNLAKLPKKLAEYGADHIILVDHPVLETYITEPYVKALTEVIKTHKPDIVLCGATAIGRDMAPRISARLHTGLTADCTSLEIQENTNYLMMTRPAFGGNIMATILCPDHRPQMATVRSGVMQKLAPVLAPEFTQELFIVEDLESAKNIEILDIIKKFSETVDIGEANILIAGGRGMGGKENFSMLEDLAEALGGSVCASRAAVDAGWRDKNRQVGQTGKTVRPNLYVACGISGALQHLAGMEESDIIIAINKDASAPIFEVADYGIVGDACKIVPLLTQAILRYKESSRRSNMV